MKKQDFVIMVKAAIESLRLQNEPSFDERLGCSYKKDSKCCIVGFMMPDDETRKEADASENPGIRALYLTGFEWTDQFSEDQIDVLESLQKVHDSNTQFWDTEIRCNRMSDIIRAYEVAND